MWHNAEVSSSILQTLLTTCALLAGAVFVTAFKIALREACRNRTHSFEPELPRAELYQLGNRPGNQWHRGAGKQQLVRRLQFVQAGFVAVGVTSIFVMFLCMTGVVALMVVGSW